MGKPTTTDPGATPEDFDFAPAPPVRASAATIVAWFRTVGPDLRQLMALMHADLELERIDRAMRAIVLGLPQGSEKPARWKALLRSQRELTRARDRYRLVLTDKDRRLAVFR